MKIFFSGIIVGIIWKLCFKTGYVSLHDFATKLWINQQKKEVEWIGRYMQRSGWHGYNVKLDGKNYVIQMTEQQSQDTP